jgi:hypothetical protein
MIYVLLAYPISLYVIPVTNPVRTPMEEMLSCKAFLEAQDCSYISGPATCWKAGSWWEDPVLLLTADLVAVVRSLGLCCVLVLYL